MIRTSLVQPLYLGIYATYWRYGTETTVRVKNSNGVWCCLTHAKDSCPCVEAVKAYDAIHGHSEGLFPFRTTLTQERGDEHPELFQQDEVRTPAAGDRGPSR